MRPIIASALIITALLAISPTLPAAELLIHSAATTAGWSPYNGGEFPGATSAIANVADADRGTVLQGSFTFSGESMYSGVLWSGVVRTASAIGFWIRLPNHTHCQLRIRDNTDQEHLGGFPVRQGEWTRVEVPLTPTNFPNHWAGPNDGEFHYPLKAVFIGVSRGPEVSSLLLSDLFAVTDDVLPSEALGVEIKPETASGIAIRGERARYRVTVTNRLAQPCAPHLTVTAQSAADIAPRRLLSREVPLDGWSDAGFPITLPTSQLGYWRLGAAAEVTGAAVRAETESGLAVVPRARHYGRPAPDCYFGLQFIVDMEAAERLGCKTVREAPGWRWAEPRPGMILWDSYLDPIMEANFAHHMNVLLTLQPIAPNWVSWASGPYPGAGGLPAPEYLDQYQRFVQAVAERYRGKLGAIEIANEPDLTCWVQPAIPFEAAADYYAEMLRVARAGVRAGDPDLPVAGIDVSGGDFDGDLPFTRAILDRAADQLDLYTGHIYSGTRYFGPGLNPIWPVQNALPEKARRALDLLESHGLPRRMWIGELGWGLDVTQPSLSEYSMDFAACIAQALIAGKTVPGMDKFLYFTCWGCNEGGYEYGLTRGPQPYPLPAAMAYASCAYWLDGTSAGELAQPAPGVWRAVFRCPSRAETIVAWWTDGDQVRLEPTGKTYRAGVWRDSFFAPLQPSDEGFLVGRLPVYWITPEGAGAHTEQQLDGVVISASEPLAVEQVRLATQDTLAARLTNRTNSPLPVTLQTGEVRVGLTLHPAEASRDVSLKLPSPVPAGGQDERTVTITAGGQRRQIPVKSALSPLPAPPAVFAADGNLSEWSALPPVCDLHSRSDLLPPDPNIGWNGPADLSARAWLAADARGLAFSLEVRDDVLATPATGPDDYWGSDGIQIALDPRNDSLAGYGPDDREIGLVLSPAGGRAFLTVPGPRGALSVPVAIQRQGDLTCYEALLTWNALQIAAPAPGTIMAINFIINENDGQGRNCWMGMTPGIGEMKAPVVFRRFVILPRS